MKKQLRRIAFVTVFVLGVFAWGIVTDSRELREGLLRLHVVGASNDEADQAVKFIVQEPGNAGRWGHN